jgi:hypothetical protein
MRIVYWDDVTRGKDVTASDPGRQVARFRAAPVEHAGDHPTEHRGRPDRGERAAADPEGPRAI